MAENKKSFIGYCDWIEIFEELEDVEAGKLIKHLLKYVNDQDPQTTDREVKLCFIPIKQSLKRDLKKYDNYIDKQKANGKKGGRPLKDKTQITQPLISKPKKADSVSVSDSVSGNNNKGKIINIDFKPYQDKYKTYAKIIMQDAGKLEAHSREHKMTGDKEVYTPTVRKYLEKFLHTLNTSEEKHENLGKFNLHFSNWLRKRDIKNVVKRKEPIRYS